MHLAGRYELRSGEHGHIDDEVEVWDVARGVCDSVGEDYAAFGVGVVSLDVFSGVAGEYVVVADRVGSDGVFGEAEDEDYAGCGCGGGVF